MLKKVKDKYRLRLSRITLVCVFFPKKPHEDHVCTTDISLNSQESLYTCQKYSTIVNKHFPFLYRFYFYRLWIKQRVNYTKQNVCRKENGISFNKVVQNSVLIVCSFKFFCLRLDSSSMMAHLLRDDSSFKKNQECLSFSSDFSLLHEYNSIFVYICH